MAQGGRISARVRLGNTTIEMSAKGITRAAWEDFKRDVDELWDRYEPDRYEPPPEPQPPVVRHAPPVVPPMPIPGIAYSLYWTIRTLSPEKGLPYYLTKDGLQEGVQGNAWRFTSPEEAERARDRIRGDYPFPLVVEGPFYA
jgi:hypothetical protein